MRFFFNDVEVTEAEHNRLIKEGAMAVELAEKQKEQERIKAEQEEKRFVSKKPRARKVAKRAVFQEIAKLVTPITKTSGKSKTEMAADIIRGIGVSNKESCVVEIMSKLGVTKSNAQVYLYNVVKKGLV